MVPEPTGTVLSCLEKEKAPLVQLFRDVFF
jgi:hypothetical protein